MIWTHPLVFLTVSCFIISCQLRKNTLIGCRYPWMTRGKYPSWLTMLNTRTGQLMLRLGPRCSRTLISRWYLSTRNSSSLSARIRNSVPWLWNCRAVVRLWSTASCSGRGKNQFSWWMVSQLSSTLVVSEHKPSSTTRFRTPTGLWTSTWLLMRLRWVLFGMSPRLTSRSTTLKCGNTHYSQKTTRLTHTPPISSSTRQRLANPFRLIIANTYCWQFGTMPTRHWVATWCWQLYQTLFTWVTIAYCSSVWSHKNLWHSYTMPSSCCLATHPNRTSTSTWTTSTTKHRSTINLSLTQTLSTRQKAALRISMSSRWIKSRSIWEKHQKNNTQSTS